MTLLGLQDTARPEGDDNAETVTEPLKPLRLVKVRVEMLELPACTVMLEDWVVSSKPGGCPTAKLTTMLCCNGALVDVRVTEYWSGLVVRAVAHFKTSVPDGVVAESVTKLEGDKEQLGGFGRLELETDR